MIPDWILSILEDGRNLFGLGGPEWDVHVKMTDKPGGNAAAGGWALVNSKYLDADIELSVDLDNNRTGRAAILHEVLHVALHETDDMVDDIIEQLDEDRQEYFHTAYTKAMERTIQRISRSMEQFIYMKKEVEDDSHETPE